ncbi:hypothetical protein C1645_786935 [Glomus cerebriforme]|uniref:Phosphatidylglycerol/phosphatidylinositol transfer protein n=1 Tax=Glomus cerebriforme TaxID=658196 RepID=A0A397SK40_9GLOM|nr:hypothetical protein C1645_786935 [Glomus cerebriforme]
MNNFVILFFTILLILNNNVGSSPLINKRHGPFVPCAGNYPNIIDNFAVKPNQLAYGQQVFVTFTGLRTVLIDIGATCEIAIQRDDGLAILQTSTNFCYNSVGNNCPLPPGDSAISISFPMPLNPPVSNNPTDTIIHRYTMAFSSKLSIFSYCIFYFYFLDLIIIIFFL